MADRNQVLRRHLFIIAIYALVALVVIGNQPLRLFDHFIGSDTGDTTEMARNVWHFTYALRNGISPLDQPLLGYPDGIDGSVLMTVPLQYFPMWLLAFLLPLPVAYNLVVILWMALNGWSMYWLLLDRLRQQVPALIGGLVYLAFPLFQGHLAEGHAGLLVAWGAPLYLWALFRLVESPRWQWRWSLATAGFFYLSTTGHILQAIYVLLPLTAVFVLGLLAQRNRAGIMRVVVVSGCAALVVLLLLFPAIRSASEETAYTTVESSVRYSADLLAPVTPSFLHPLFDRLLPYARSVLGTNLGEGMAYSGLLVSGLALLALLVRRDARWWLLLLLVAWVLSLGPLLKWMDQPLRIQSGEYSTYITLPFAFLENLPGFSLARTPARFNFTAAIALAALAAYGVSVLVAGEGRTRGKRRYLWVIMLAAGILFEYQSFWGQPLRPARIPDAVAALRDDASIRAVFDVPYQYVLAAKDSLYLQTAHQHPLIAGQITRQTPVNPAKLDILQATLDPALLYEAGADVVIFHHARLTDSGEAQALRNRLNRQLGAPFYQDERIALYRVVLPATVTAQAVLPQQSGITGDVARYPLYVPEDQWVDVMLDFTAEGRDLLLLLDDRPAHFWNIGGNRVFQLPLALEAGYHNLTVQVVPPCAVQSDPLLRCLTVSYAVSGEALPGELRGGTTYDGGITLRWVDLRVEGDQLDVRLFWVLNEARSTRDVRFVHVVDRSGQVIVQRDTPPGMLDANSIYPELVSLAIGDLPAGQYSVRVGWYRLEETGAYTNYLANGQPFYTIGEFRR